MLLLSWWWLSRNYNLELEDNLVRWTSLVKRILPFTTVHDPNRINDYTFIDTSGSKTLVAQDVGLGRDVITDRSHLDSLFRLMARAVPPPRAIACDVFFDRATEYDDNLQHSIGTLEGIIFPYRFDGEHVTLPAIAGISSAYSAYWSSSGVGLKDSFLKFHLVDGDTMKSLPLRMFESLTKKKFSRFAGLLWGGGDVMYNAIIPDIKILPGQLSDGEFDKIIPLEDLLVMRNDDAIREFFSQKIVVVGDFQTEMHTSIYDKIPGVLIIVNVLESLLAGEATINWLMVLYLVACYAILSYLVFFYQGGPDSLQDRVAQISYPLVGRIGSRMLGFSLALYIVSVICYFVFNVHTDILPMATYLSLLSLCKRNWPAIRKRIVRTTS